MNRSQMPVDNADGPNNRRLRALLQGAGVNMDSTDSTWPITRVLREKGYSDYDADKIIQAAAVESIVDHPVQYLAGRPLALRGSGPHPSRFSSFLGAAFMPLAAFRRGQIAFDGRAAYIPNGQVTWTAPLWQAACKAFLRVAWHPNSIVIALSALASAAGCVVMIRDPSQREAGLAAASILLVISLTTAFFGWPQYRFRLPLEPIMIVAVVPAVLSLWHRFSRAAESLRSVPRDMATQSTRQ